MIFRITFAPAKMGYPLTEVMPPQIGKQADQKLPHRHLLT